MELLGQLYSLVLWYLRPLVKWFLRQTTRLCELQRICYGEPTGAPRTLAVGEYRIYDEVFNARMGHPIDKVSYSIYRPRIMMHLVTCHNIYVKTKLPRVQFTGVTPSKWMG